MNKLFLAGSPLAARATFPYLKFILAISSLAIFIILIWFIFKKISDYHKSPAFIEKEKNRLTTKKDVYKVSKYYHIPKNQADILWEICNITACKNINYSIHNTDEVYDMFRTSYLKMKESGISDLKLNDFFNLLYKIETIAAEEKSVLSTKFLRPTTVVFFINDFGEQFPMYVIKNTPDAFYIEMPEFLYNSPHRPKVLEKQRFTFKNETGIAFNFVSRIMRYEVTKENQILMIVSHTDKIESTVQRHYKREFIQETADFSAIKINKESKNENDLYIISDKKYTGNLANISAGGCCIETSLPVKENQHLCIMLDRLGVDEKIVGLIKRTRRLPNGNFALHIQFLKISIRSKNRLYTFVYKYEL